MSKSLVNTSIDLMQFFRKINLKFLAKFMQRFIRIFLACDIPYTVQIGKGTKFMHNGLGVVVHAKTIIGEDCKILHNVTIGGRNGKGQPIIEDKVLIGAGACILGGITIGTGASVGANSVVLKDVPPNSTVIGIPAQILEKKQK